MARFGSIIPYIKNGGFVVLEGSTTTNTAVLKFTILDSYAYVEKTQLYNSNNVKIIFIDNTRQCLVIVVRKIITRCFCYIIEEIEITYESERCI